MKSEKIDAAAKIINYKLAISNLEPRFYVNNSVDNYVDNYVDNFRKSCGYQKRNKGMEDSHRVICMFSATFPQIFDGKRYKLSNFAPKLEIVDK